MRQIKSIWHPGKGVFTLHFDINRKEYFVQWKRDFNGQSHAEYAGSREKAELIWDRYLRWAGI